MNYEGMLAASVRHNFWMLAAFLRHGQVLLLKIVAGWGKKKSAFSLKENPERQMGESRSVRQSHFCFNEDTQRNDSIVSTNNE